MPSMCRGLAAGLSTRAPVQFAVRVPADEVRVVRQWGDLAGSDSVRMGDERRCEPVISTCHSQLNAEGHLRPKQGVVRKWPQAVEPPRPEPGDGCRYPRCGGWVLVCDRLAVRALARRLIGIGVGCDVVDAGREEGLAGRGDEKGATVRLPHREVAGRREWAVTGSGGPDGDYDRHRSQ